MTASEIFTRPFARLKEIFDSKQVKAARAANNTSFVYEVLSTIPAMQSHLPVFRSQ